MAEYKLKEIKEIMRCTPKELVGTQISDIPYGQKRDIGFYRKPSANWSYVVYCISWRGNMFEVVTVFGDIRGE